MRLSTLVFRRRGTYLSVDIKGDLGWSSKQLGKLCPQASVR